MTTKDTAIDEAALIEQIATHAGHNYQMDDSREKAGPANSYKLGFLEGFKFGRDNSLPEPYRRGLSVGAVERDQLEAELHEAKLLMREMAHALKYMTYVESNRALEKYRASRFCDKD